MTLRNFCLDTNSRKFYDNRWMEVLVQYSMAAVSSLRISIGWKKRNYILGYWVHPVSSCHNTPLGRMVNKAISQLQSTKFKPSQYACFGIFLGYSGVLPHSKDSTTLNLQPGWTEIVVKEEEEVHHVEWAAGDAYWRSVGVKFAHRRRAHSKSTHICTCFKKYVIHLGGQH